MHGRGPRGPSLSRSVLGAGKRGGGEGSLRNLAEMGGCKGYGGKRWQMGVVWKHRHFCSQET